MALKCVDDLEEGEKRIASAQDVKWETAVEMGSLILQMKDLHADIREFQSEVFNTYLQHN